MGDNQNQAAQIFERLSHLNSQDQKGVNLMNDNLIRIIFLTKLLFPTYSAPAGGPCLQDRITFIFTLFIFPRLSDKMYPIELQQSDPGTKLMSLLASSLFCGWCRRPSWLRVVCVLNATGCSDTMKTSCPYFHVFGSTCPVTESCCQPLRLARLAYS